MYKIIKDGSVFALTETPNYIRLQKNGCFGLCNKDRAHGIVYNGTVYHLLGREPLEGKETVMLVEEDSGSTIFNTSNALADIDAMTVDQEYRLMLMELGITDIESL